MRGLPNFTNADSSWAFKNFATEPELPAENNAWKDTKLESSKYLNNLIEQDHRGIESRIVPMLGFKDFNLAAITIAGIELPHRIRKD